MEMKKEEKMDTTRINNVTIAYERFGNGPSLLLIHGFPLDHTSWIEAASLLKNEFDIILPDLRGFGQSTNVETPYTISDMADDLAGLLDHFGIEKTMLAGHSMGGYVALAFAKKYSQRVSGLGLISSQAIGDPPDRKEGRYKTASDVAEKGVGVVVEAMTTKLSTDARVQAFVRNVMEKQSKDGVIGALKAMAEREDLMSILLSFRDSFMFPLLLIHGDVDMLIPIDRSKEIKVALPSVQFVELQGAGHMPMMEFAKETAEGLKLLLD